MLSPFLKTVLLFSLLAGSALADLQRHTLKMVPEIRGQIAMIGRLGLHVVRPAVSIGPDGHLLAAKIESVDGTDTPYLLYHPDGSREVLETLAEPRKRPVVLLRKPENFALKPTPISSLLPAACYLPVLSPAPVINEPVMIDFYGTLSLEQPSENVFGITSASPKPGTPVLNLNGHLAGVVLPHRQKDNAKLSRVLSFSRLASDLELLASMPVTNQPEPRVRAPGQTLPHEAVGVVVNDDKPFSYSVHGTIIRSDGLILTKASELGPKLTFRFRGQDYPAALLATDLETDLAIVGVQAKGLPTIDFADTPEPAPGTLVHFQTLVGNEEEDEPTVYIATYSHRLPEHLTTIHHTNRGTSLGIVTEQLQNNLTISAIRTGGPAAGSNLKPGDRILKIDNTVLPNRETLVRFLSTKKIGDQVSLTIQREGATLAQAIEIKLGVASLVPETTGISIREPQACVPSVYRGPFPKALVHALPLNSWDCGSPLLDFSNRVHGINIAAVTGNRSLALSNASVRSAIKRMMTSLSF